MIDIAALHQLENLNVDTAIVQYENSDQLTLRQKAIKEAALEVGTQSGLYMGQKIINQSLEKIESTLYQAYNFNVLLLNDNILPPVIETGYNHSSVEDNAQEVNVTGQLYHIVKQAHFVSNVPTWRTYLITSFSKPEWPDNSVLPKNAQEEALWKKTVRHAWSIGIGQSLDIFKQNLHQLNRDFNGMLTYYQLLNHNMITHPYITRETTAIQHNSNRLAIDNTKLNLELSPQFQSNSALWAVILDPTENLSTKKEE